VSPCIFVLQLPQEGTPLQKHVGVLIIVIKYILLNTFLSGCCDSKIMRGMNNTKFPSLLSLFATELQKLNPFPSSGVKIKKLQHFWPFAITSLVLTDATVGANCLLSLLSEELSQVWIFTPDDYITERTC
jgi:hypothetical protein